VESSRNDEYGSGMRSSAALRFLAGTGAQPPAGSAGAPTDAEALDAYSTALRERLGRRAAVEVVDVMPGSPAARAGFRSGDLLLALDGALIETVGDLQRSMVEAVIARPVAVRVLRAGDVIDLIVEPVEL
jgi:S1-C subfamily serine protease